MTAACFLIKSALLTNPLGFIMRKPLSDNTPHPRTQDDLRTSQAIYSKLLPSSKRVVDAHAIGRVL